MPIRSFNSSKRINDVQSPVIPIIGDLIKKYPETISLGQGIAYYGPPESVYKKINKIDSKIGYHAYSEVEGIDELRAEVTQKLLYENKIKINSKRKILISAGSNMSFMNALMVITNPDDEIILLRPYYFNHEMAINMINCKVMAIDTDHTYQPCLEKIANAITSRTRAIVTVSPNNPSGAVYPKSTLIEINKLCRDNKIYHISDEAYEYFTYDKTKHFSPGSIENTEDYTISLYSLSKAYGLASWRIGYMVIPEHLFNSVKKVQDTYLICPTRIAQDAAIAALKTGRSFTIKHLKQIEYVRVNLYAELKKINNICTLPFTMGAFYFFIKLKTNLTGFELVDILIKKYKIAAIPGEPFGMNRGCYLRISYGALNKEMSKIGTQRLIKGLNETIS